MSRFDVVRGVDVREDWDNFLWNKLRDYYVVQESIDGAYFSVSDGAVSVEKDQVVVLDTLTQSRLCDVLSTTKGLIVTGVVVGKDISTNPYELQENKIFIVDVFNTKTGMQFGAQELQRFVEMISINAYGKEYTLAEVICLVDFKDAVKAIQDLPDGAYTDEIEMGIVSSFNALLHTPSCVNSTKERKGLTFSGLFDYTFHYTE